MHAALPEEELLQAVAQQAEVSAGCNSNQLQWSPDAMILLIELGKYKSFDGLTRYVHLAPDRTPRLRPASDHRATYYVQGHRNKSAEHLPVMKVRHAVSSIEEDLVHGESAQ
jgi:hypothetical protein